MNEDTPDDVVHTQLMEAVFPDHPLGRETLGSEDTILAMTRDQIAAFHAGWYRPGQPGGGRGRRPAPRRRWSSAWPPSWAAPRWGTVRSRLAPAVGPEPLVVAHRPTEQAHVAMAWRGLDHHDPDRYALAVANQILGGGMSSRLFQEVREERGLAYSVFTSPASLRGHRRGHALRRHRPVPGRRAARGHRRHHRRRCWPSGITDEELAVAKGYLEGATAAGPGGQRQPHGPSGLGTHHPRRDRARRRAPGPHPGGDRGRGRRRRCAASWPPPPPCRWWDRSPTTTRCWPAPSTGPPPALGPPDGPEREPVRGGPLGWRHGASGVFGAGGRMGTEVCRAVVADPDLELVAVVDPFHVGLDLGQVTGVDLHLSMAAGPEALLDAGVDVAVDFTAGRGGPGQPGLAGRQRGARGGGHDRAAPTPTWTASPGPSPGRTR